MTDKMKDTLYRLSMLDGCCDGTYTNEHGGCGMVVAFVCMAFAILCSICSCSRMTSASVVVDHVRTDTLLQRAYSRDSIVLHDSVYVDRWRDGETVYVSRDRVRTEYRDRVRRDTLREVRVDSIPYPVEVEVSKAARLSWWQVVLMWTGALSLVAVCVYVYRIIKKC